MRVSPSERERYSVTVRICYIHYSTHSQMHDLRMVPSQLSNSESSNEYWILWSKSWNVMFPGARLVYEFRFQLSHDHIPLGLLHSRSVSHPLCALCDQLREIGANLRSDGVDARSSESGISVKRLCVSWLAPPSRSLERRNGDAFRLSSRSFQGIIDSNYIRMMISFAAHFYQDW